MKEAYILQGVEEEYLMVFRSDALEDLLFVIQRLAACRDKKIKAMAKQLEEDWNRIEYRRYSGGAEPKST
jgi:hypothetical protein